MEKVDNLLKTLAAITTVLTEKEKEVILRRYGLIGNRQTLREIAQDMGVKHQAISATEQRAIEKMKEFAKTLTSL